MVTQEELRAQTITQAARIRAIKATRQEAIQKEVISQTRAEAETVRRAEAEGKVSEWRLAYDIIGGGRERFFMKHPTIGPKIRHLWKYGVKGLKEAEREAFYEAGYKSGEIELVAGKYRVKAGVGLPMEVKMIPIPKVKEPSRMELAQMDIKDITAWERAKGIGKELWKTKLLGIRAAPIGFAPEAVAAVKAEAEFVRRKVTERLKKPPRPKPVWVGRVETAWERIARAKIKPDEIPKDIKYPSITQKYYELFGVEFYKKGERQAIINRELKPFMDAKTFEEQERMMKVLREKGIKFKLTNEHYEIDPYSLAPTSKFGNYIIGLTDFMFKLRFFSPYMTTAAAQRTEQVLVKRKLTEREKFELYKKTLEEARVKVSSSELREAFRKIVKGGDPNKIRISEKIIKDFFAQTKEGQAAARAFIKDIKAQEFIPTAAPPTPTVEIISPGAIPELERLPEVATSIWAGTGRYERYAPSENIFIRRVVEREPGLGESIFIGTAPTGKIKPLDVGRISGLGVMEGRLGVITATTQAALEKAAQDKATRQRALQAAAVRQRAAQQARQRVLQATALASQLKFKQIQQLRLKQIQQLKYKIRYPKPRVTTVPTLKILPLLFRAPGDIFGKRIVRKVKQAYDVQVRREGKWKLISEKPLPKGKAHKLGVKRTITTLAATYRLIKKGTTTAKDIPYKPSSKHFRAPKSKAPLTFVERKNLRLKKGSEEISEILKIRKGKPKKKKRRGKKWF